MNMNDFNAKILSTTSIINNVAAAALAVENMAATAVASGAQAMTGQQKLQVATSIVAALDPPIAPTMGTLNALFEIIVQGWHVAGMFTSSKSAAMPAPTPTPAPANYQA